MPEVTVCGKPYETDLVIFDKDGTLLDFETTWVGIIGELVASLGGHAPDPRSLKARIERALGLSLDNGSIDGNGALAMGTFTECNALLAYSLYREGIRWDRAQALVEEVGSRVFSPAVRKKHVCAAQGALPLLKALKSRGIATAVATNDKHGDAVADMEIIGAAPFIDLVVGAECVAHAKPAPDMVDLICGRLGAAPGQAILIGDTAMDAMLGRNARVMLTIGVTGIVPASELSQFMDIVIASLSEIV